MSCPPGIAFLQGSEGEESRNSESRSSRAEVESEKANSKTSLSSELAGRKENGGKSQPVDLTQVAILQTKFTNITMVPKRRYDPVSVSHYFGPCHPNGISMYVVSYNQVYERVCKSIKIFSKVDNALATMTSWQRKKGKLC